MSAEFLLPPDDPDDDERERYRLYELDRAGELVLLGTTGTREGIGVALVQWADDRAEAGITVTPPPVGVLDRVEHRWIVGLWPTPR